MDEHLVMIIAGVLTTTTEEDIRRTFEELELGNLDKIDTKNDKILVYYNSLTSDGQRLRARLDDNKKRQKQGEFIQPVKIVYESINGRDKYWLVYS